MMLKADELHNCEITFLDYSQYAGLARLGNHDQSIQATRI